MVFLVVVVLSVFAFIIGAILLASGSFDVLLSHSRST